MLSARKPAINHVKNLAGPATARVPESRGDVDSLGGETQWAPSPARAMQDQLAQRLNPDLDGARRPSPLIRLAIILGISSALWAMIGGAVFVFLK